jgi:thiol:disulfide interchange protein
VALIIAIISLLICLIPVVGAIGALVALGLGIGAWMSSRSQQRPQGLAIAATVIAGLAFLVGVVWSIVAIAFLGDKIDSFDEADRYCQTNTTTQEDYDVCMQEEWLGIDASP